MKDFITDFRCFLDSLKLNYREQEYDFIIDIDETGSRQLHITTLPLSYFQSEKRFKREEDTIYIFEDRWWSTNEMVKSRILVHIDKGKTIFARNCIVKPLTTVIASAFLNQNHSYQSAKSEYRYGLYRKRRTSIVSECEGAEGELVAVATFSAPRPMFREFETSDGFEKHVVQSYEWVRYASLNGTRVIGGMGKLMQKFIEDINPEEIMSYSDYEWSSGNVYAKLGFRKVGEREPVSFLIDMKTMERISEKKLYCDKKYRNTTLSENNFCRIENLGSAKWLINLPLIHPRPH